MCFPWLLGQNNLTVIRKVPESNIRLEDANHPEPSAFMYSQGCMQNLVTLSPPCLIMDQRHSPSKPSSPSLWFSPVCWPPTPSYTHTETCSQLSNLSVSHLHCILNLPSSWYFSASLRHFLLMLVFGVHLHVLAPLSVWFQALTPPFPPPHTEVLILAALSNTLHASSRESKWQYGP